MDAWLTFVGVFSAISTEDWLVKLVTSRSSALGDDSAGNPLSLWTGLHASSGLLHLYANMLHRSHASVAGGA